MTTADGDLIVVPDDDVQSPLTTTLHENDLANLASRLLTMGTPHLGIASSTASMRSSIIDYRHENGRRYHRYKDGKYNFPNDDQENERLEHHLCLLTLGNKLGLSPPNLPDSKVKRVLDLGTGTGIWAIDFGDEHPEAEIIGIDLSPIQPSL
ncbi:uncharacterized protein BKA55DRAFT_71240 [Fusarium redolens]|uniref:Methyltransferase n=1 Tax=Fusarium redolens TaxID=48865 RepID=A0A9P9GYN2_FUSRE|nr:uncharacterized protein BKA55DRAFT_71240 [Fusarium redolens]KAH7247651.1 hypothetical protein BKA55DRAFT_71240 [Fusarium redolens]